MLSPFYPRGKNFVIHWTGGRESHIASLHVVAKWIILDPTRKRKWQRSYVNAFSIATSFISERSTVVRYKYKTKTSLILRILHIFCRKPSYNVKLWRVAVTTVTMENQQCLICVLLSYMSLSTIYKYCVAHSFMVNYATVTNKTYACLTM